MEIIVRPTTIEDAAALVEIYSQPKAQRETLQLPNPSLAMWLDKLSNLPAGMYSYVAAGGFAFSIIPSAKQWLGTSTFQYMD